MTWLVWRQHRGEIVGGTALLAMLGILLLLHGAPMHAAYQRDGIEACQLQLLVDEAGSCTQAVMSFEGTWAYLPGQVAAWLPFLPMLAGMLIGAPLLAREFEQGTWELAWTQGVTRRRWLATKLALVLGGVGAMSVLFAAGVSWWFGPLTPHTFTTAKFNHAVLAFPAYVLVAVAVGVLAGVVARRTLVAAAMTVGGYLAVRIPVEFSLRPRYREPLTIDEPTQAVNGWVVHDSGFGGPVAGSATPEDLVRYHPDDRFWEFQLIETAILLGITALLLAIAWRLVLGRRAPASGGPRREERVVGSRSTAPAALAPRQGDA